MPDKFEQEPHAIAISAPEGEPESIVVHHGDPEQRGTPADEVHEGLGVGRVVIGSEVQPPGPPQ